MFPGQCGNTAFFFKSQPDQFHFEFRGIVFPGKSFFSAHEVSTCKISGCLSYRILDSGPDGTQTTLTLKMAYILSMSEQVKLKAFLAAVLDDYKLGAISQQQAVGGITSLVDAIEISDSGKISLMLSEGRKLLRTG